MGLHFKEFNFFQHLLHGSITVSPKLKDIGNSTLIDHLGYDFFSFAKLNYFFIALFVKDGNNIFQWLLHVTHAVLELFFDLVEPFEHTN